MNDSAQVRESIRKAIIAKDMKQVRTLVSLCTIDDINYRDNGCGTLLKTACAHQCLDAVNILLDAGADVNVDQPVLSAITYHGSNDDIATLLIERGVHIAEPNGSALVSAAVVSGAVKLLRALIQKGAVPGSVVTWGANIRLNRPLIDHAVAHFTGTVEIELVQVLAQAGCPVNTGWDDATPLQMAARYGEVEVAAILLDYGATIDAVDSSGMTPLHYAVSRNCANVASLLLSRGANVNRASNVGDTPLQTAAQRAGVSLVPLLVRHRANIYVLGLPFEVLSARATKCLEHTYIVDLALVFSAIDLPGYCLLWIIEWLPHMRLLTELAKITLITNVVASIRRVREARRINTCK